MLLLFHICLFHTTENVPNQMLNDMLHFLHIRLFLYIYVSCTECNEKEIQNFITFGLGANVFLLFFLRKKGFCSFICLHYVVTCL